MQITLNLEEAVFVGHCLGFGSTAVAAPSDIGNMFHAIKGIRKAAYSLGEDAFNEFILRYARLTKAAFGLDPEIGQTSNSEVLVFNSLEDFLDYMDKKNK